MPLLKDTKLKPSKVVSGDLLNTFSFFEQYSAAAYCENNNIATSSTNITCDAGNCPLVQSAGAQSLLEFQKYSYLPPKHI